VERVKAKMKLQVDTGRKKESKKAMLKCKMEAENRGFGAQLYWLTRNATYFSEKTQLA
jgi:hypothetical protein